MYEFGAQEKRLKYLTELSKFITAACLVVLE